MNRTRLDAESIRDAVLSIAGKLDLTMGGPSVKQFVESPGIHVTPKVDYVSFDVDSPASSRRSIYRFLFRTLPDPFMETMDCPDASQLAPRRESSVTALQALAMLNDRFIVRRASTSRSASWPLTRRSRPRSTCSSSSCSAGALLDGARELRGLRRTQRHGERLSPALQQQRVHVRELMDDRAEPAMSRERCEHSGQYRALPRREFLWRLGGGLGGIALAQLLGRSQLLAQTSSLAAGADLNGGLHHRAKVRRVIQLFMNGGVSQIDTFDYKPELSRRHGEKFDPGERVESVTGSHADFPILKSPFEFQQHGETGRWVSSVFPALAEHVDDLAFLMSMASKTNVHGPGSYMMNTGFMLPGFPCMGAWITYGLGSSSDNLPAFVVLPDPRGLPYNNLGNFSSAFLPVSHQGVVINATAPTPVHDLLPPASAAYITPRSEAELLALLGAMNREYAARDESDSRLEGRIASYELAARMQLSVPGVFDLSGESAATRRLYGLDEKPTEEFGTRCLLARRMLERGVRFVQVWSGPPARRATGTTTPISRPSSLRSPRWWTARSRGCSPTSSRAACSRTRWSSSRPSSGGSLSVRGARGATTTAGPSSAGSRGRESGRGLRMARAMSGGGGRGFRSGATTCTRRFFTCSGSTTRGSRSGTMGPTGGSRMCMGR